MYKCLLINSEYCSMGRWISVIVGHKMNMKLYEGKDLLALANEDWLTPEYLASFDNKIAKLSITEVKALPEFQKVYTALSTAILKAVEQGPCIIHERAAATVLGDTVKYLSVLLYNKEALPKIPRARADKTYDLQDLSDDQVISFMCEEDKKRKHYHDAVSKQKWEDKESYDICLDSEVLGREKCAEIIIEAMKPVSLDLEECQTIIKESFTWTQ